MLFIYLGYEHGIFCAQRLAPGCVLCYAENNDEDKDLEEIKDVGYSRACLEGEKDTLEVGSGRDKAKYDPEKCRDCEGNDPAK
jgi:hypothetical protein